MPAVSIIIPTHNRSASVRRTLDALCRQNYPASQFEVRVVADGCVDNTVQMLQHYEAPFTLHIIQEGRPAEGVGTGPPAARNAGAKKARGGLLLFLDDDVEPSPALVGEHVLAHENRKQGGVVVAPYPPAFPKVGFLQMQLRAWWEGVFEAFSRPGHRFTYKDLLSGNLSIDAHLFARMGGFDEHPDIFSHEDYEFGVRLIKAGVPFASAPGALARHHEVSDLHRVIRRKRREGVADVYLARLHPEISETLPLVRPWLTGIGPQTTGILKRLAFTPSGVRETLFALLRNNLRLLERMRLRDEWNRFSALLQAYAYWCGVAESVKSHRTFNRLLADIEKHIAATPPAVPLQIDLQLGIETAERRLDEERPSAAKLHVGPRAVGLIPAKPGAEPLKGAHLRPILATTLAVPFLEALALEGAPGPVPHCLPMFVTEQVSQATREALAQSIRRRGPWFGPVQQGKMWYEQYSQWNEFEHAVHGTSSHRNRSRHRQNDDPT